jgi:hypothetical protein
MFPSQQAVTATGAKRYIPFGIGDGRLPYSANRSALRYVRVSRIATRAPAFGAVDIQCVELTDQISEYDCAIAGMAATFLHLVFSGGTGSQQHLGSHTSQKSGLDVCCKIHPAVALPRRPFLAAIADQPVAIH